MTDISLMIWSIILIKALALTSCSATEMQERDSVRQGKNKSDSPNSEDQNDPSKEKKEEQPDGPESIITDTQSKIDNTMTEGKESENLAESQREQEPEDDEIVSEPVQVGGSFLTCQAHGWNQAGKGKALTCLMNFKNDEDKFELSDVDKVMLTDPKAPKNKKEVEFRELSSMSFEIDLPKNGNGMWKIEVILHNGKVMTDMEIEQDFISGNLIQDHSFEDYDTSEKTRSGSDYVIVPKDEFKWNFGGLRESCTNGGTPSAEIVIASSKVPAANGKQFVDLDADCGALFNLSGANIFLEQKIKTELDRKYVVSFYYNARTNSNGRQPKGATASFNALLNGKEFFSAQGIAYGDWKRIKYTFRANSSTTTLRFEEHGLGDFYGTVLDDIRVIPYPNQAIFYR